MKEKGHSMQEPCGCYNDFIRDTEEIDRLRDENERLRAALNPETVARKLAFELGYTWGSSGFRQDEFIEHVRAALGAPLIGFPPA